MMVPLVLYGLIALTDPSGLKVFVERNSVFTISSNLGACHSDAKTKITSNSSVFVCVKEPPEEVVKRFAE